MFWWALLAIAEPAPASAAATSTSGKAYLIVTDVLPAPQRIDPLDNIVEYGRGFPRELSPKEVPSLPAGQRVRAAGACLAGEAMSWAPIFRLLSPKPRLDPIDRWPEAAWPCPKWRDPWALQMWLDTADGGFTVSALWVKRKRALAAGDGGLQADEAVIVLRKDNLGKIVSVQVMSLTAPERVLELTADKKGLHLEVERIRPQCYRGKKGMLRRDVNLYPPSPAEKLIRTGEHFVREIECPAAFAPEPTPEEIEKKRKLDAQTEQMIRLLSKPRPDAGQKR